MPPLLLFLTGTLRCCNTDFFFWLNRPGVSILCRGAMTAAAAGLALYQQPPSNWDLLRGTPKETDHDPVSSSEAAAWPWHCVCCSDESAAVVVVGDVISVAPEIASQVLADLGRFFRVEEKFHFTTQVDVRPVSSSFSSSSSSLIVKDCTVFVVNPDKAAAVTSSWVRLGSGSSYLNTSTCPALPLHRQRQETDGQKKSSLAATAPPTRPPRVVIVIVDGAGDSHAPGNADSKTPLEVATSNNNNNNSDGLSTITRNGISGLMDPYEPGIACGSDTAHLNLFGFPPSLWYRGRGAFESLGAGMAMIPGKDIAFKSNFATIDDETGIVLQRRCDRNFTAEGPVLCGVLDSLPPVQVEVEQDEDDEGGDNNQATSTKKMRKTLSYSVRVKYATEHRCGVVVSGPGLSDRISGTDPLVDNKPLVKCIPFVSAGASASGEHIAAALMAAKHTCRVIEAVSDALRAALKEHPINKERIAAGKPPANVILLRGAAQTAPNPAFEAVCGLKSFVIAPTCIISGFGRSVGMTPVDDAVALGATGDVHSNLMAKATVAKRILFPADETKVESEPFDLGVVHVKGCDDAGHDGHPAVKADVLARAGTMLASIWEAAPAGTAFLIFADHSTPCAHLDHGVDPVPVSIAVKRNERGSDANHQTWKPDGVQKYTELACMFGSLGRFRGADLMTILRNVMLSHLVAA